jgi:flagellar basal body rod protein FlgB
MPGPLEIYDQTFNSLERAMKVAVMKQAVIAQNIANAKTPGYEAMTFDEQLNMAVKRQDNREVTLEEEMKDLAINSGQYSTYVKLLTSKIGVLRTIATQGKR